MPIEIAMVSACRVASASAVTDTEPPTTVDASTVAVVEPVIVLVAKGDPDGDRAAGLADTDRQRARAEPARHRLACSVGADE